MRRAMTQSAWLAPLLAAALLAPTARADSAAGDWGHFLSYHPKVHLLNPDGRAFTLTIHLMKWTIAGWNPAKAPLRVLGPDGAAVVADEFEVKGTEIVVAVPAGAKGVYTLEYGVRANPKAKGGLEFANSGNFWVEATLDHLVVWTGDPQGHVVEGRRLIAQCSVPRRWWFWVPASVSTFTVRAQRGDRYMSQREDWGITIASPRGQRSEVLWGQPLKTSPREYRQEMERVVEVEPGAGGRFWSLELRFGDAHNYSKPNVSLDGVPPYLARSPEEWFDPATGAPPAVGAYDDTPYIQAAYEPKDEARWPHLQHWTPCPSLGDPDGVEVRGAGRFALWNPDDRELRFALCTYLPRTGMGKAAGDLPLADVVVTGADGKEVLRRQMPTPHYHGHGDPPQPLPKLGTGVSTVSIGGVERWWAFTYPATPLAWLGEPAADAWARWTVEVGTARNWYFFVPRGTKTFSVRARAQHETDVLHLEVNSPDRTLALVYDRAGEKEITVPAGLDGKIWHVRLDVGSATRMVTEGGAENRYLGIYTTLELKGVPGILAPTWEQWFDPAKPQPPLARGK